METTQQTPDPPSMPVISPTMGFDEAARVVLEFLGRRLPWALWTVTRIENGHQTVLQLDERSTFDAVPGDAFPWEDSLCVKMLLGGPRVAPDLSRTPIYAEQPLAQQLGIGAYAGVPINEQDGSLFGTLCGINLTAVDDGAELDQALLELLAQLLGFVLAADRTRRDIEHTALRARLEADTDALTGVFSRRGWDSVIDDEELHQRVYADPAVVVVIDLDGLKAINDVHGHAAGDAFIKQCADTLRDTLRDTDPVARIGGDEFAVLLRNTSADRAPKQIVRLRETLAEAGVSASMGWAPHTMHGGFPMAQAAADAAMYEDKLLRRSS